MRSKADETFVTVETLICPLQISHYNFVFRVGQSCDGAAAMASERSGVTSIV